MISVGRLAVKISGRDSGKIGIVVDVIDNNHVMIDGQTRRRKCNIKHLEPLQQEIKIKKGASHADVVKELKKLNIVVKESKSKKKKSEKPIRKRITEQKRKLEEKKAKPKKEIKKADKKTLKKETKIKKK